MANEAYRTNYFTVSIDNVQSPHFHSVAGLSDGEVEAVDQPYAGSSVVCKVSANIVKYDDITLERFMDGSAADGELHEWYNDMFVADPSKGSFEKRNGAILVYRHDHVISADSAVMTFTFEGAWPKSSKFTDLKAGGTELMKQTIVLAVDRVQRETPVLSSDG